MAVPALELDILSLQGYKPSATENYIPIGFSPVEGTFPNNPVFMRLSVPVYDPITRRYLSHTRFYCYFALQPNAE